MSLSGENICEYLELKSIYDKGREHERAEMIEKLVWLMDRLKETSWVRKDIRELWEKHSKLKTGKK